MLQSGNDQQAGDSSSATVVVTTPVDALPGAFGPQVIDVYIEDPIVATTLPVAPQTAPQDLSQVFAVETAGTVTVEPTATGVLLDGVTVADGWAWTAVQPSGNELEVTFTSGDVTYVFAAALGADGTITAGVDQPIVQVVQAPALAAGSSRSSGTVSVEQTPVSAVDHDDDDHDDDHRDEYEDDHDEDEGGAHDD